MVFDNNSIISMYLDEKKSILDIGKKLGLGYKKVRNYLLKNNIELRKRNTKGLHKHSDDTKQKIRESKIGEKNPNYNKCSDETRILLRSYRDKLFSNPITKKEIYKKISETRIKKKLSVGKNNPMSNSDTVKKWAKSNKLTPNKPERLLSDVLNNLYPNTFFLNTLAEYLVIDGKIPDIVDLNNKRIIELYGDYWHKDESSEQQNERIQLFLDNGYNTLIIWEKELKNLIKLEIKINNFINYGINN